MKGSILAYIIAGTLTATCVAVGVTSVVKNKGNIIKGSTNVENQYEEDSKFAVDNNNPIDSDDKVTGKKGESGIGIGNKTTGKGNIGTSKEEQSQELVEVASGEIEVGDATIEGVLGVEDVDASDIEIEKEGNAVSNQSAKNSASGTSSLAETKVDSSIGENEKKQEETKAVDTIKSKSDFDKLMGGEVDGSGNIVVDTEKIIAIQEELGEEGFNKWYKSYLSDEVKVYESASEGEASGK